MKYKKFRILSKKIYYLCSIIKTNNMTEILIQNGFVYNDDLKHWERGTWIIRFIQNMVEVFNDPETDDGKYFMGNIYKIDLQSIIDDM